MKRLIVCVLLLCATTAVLAQKSPITLVREKDSAIVKGKLVHNNGGKYLLSYGDSLYVRKVVVGDSLGIFHEYLGNLFSRQSLLINSPVEIIHNGDNAIGRDIDFVKLRNGNLPNIWDEYGYINFRTKSSDTLALPAIQFIGMVGDTVSPNWSSGTLILRLRRGRDDNPVTQRITQYQEFYHNGPMRVDADSLDVPGFNSEILGVNGNAWFWSNSGGAGRSLDLVRSHLGASVIPDDELGVLNFWGRTTSNTYSQSAYVLARAGTTVNGTTVAGELGFGVRKDDGTMEEAMTIMPDASVVINSRPLYAGDKIDAVGTVKGSHITSSEPSVSGAGLLQVGKIVTGTDSLAYWEISVDGVLYYIRALTSLP